MSRWIYTAKEYTDMLLIYGKCDCIAARAERMYAERYPKRKHPTASTFQAAYVRVLENKPIVPTHEGKEHATRSSLSIRMEEKILNYFERNSVASLRSATREFSGVTTSQVANLLKREGRTAYAARKTDRYTAHADWAGRKAFSDWLLEKHRRDKNFLDSILWTGERIFSNHGLLNKKNLNVWRDKRPTDDERLGVDIPKRWDVKVWGAILGGKIYGPIFLPAKLNSDDYLQLINDHLVEIINDIPIGALKNLWFQHDGTPSHCTAPVCARLTEIFADRWIGRKGPVPWPAQSQDLTPIDFFLWNEIKDRVFKRNCDSAKEMRKRLRHAFDALREQCDRKPQTIRKVLKDVMLRARECTRTTDDEERDDKEILVSEPGTDVEEEAVESVTDVQAQTVESVTDVQAQTVESVTDVRAETEPVADVKSETGEDEFDLSEGTLKNLTTSLKSESLDDCSSESAVDAETEFLEDIKTESIDDVKAEPMEIVYLDENLTNIELNSEKCLVDCFSDEDRL